MGRNLDDGARAGRERRIREPDLADERADQPRRQPGAGAAVKRLRLAPAGDRRGAHRRCAPTAPPYLRASDRELTFGGADARHDRRRRNPAERSGELDISAGRHRSERVSAGRRAGELRHHRPLRAADQLHLTAGRFLRRDGDAGRADHRRLVLRLRHRRAGNAGHRRRSWRWRFTDRREHLHARRVRPLA